MLTASVRDLTSELHLISLHLRICFRHRVLISCLFISMIFSLNVSHAVPARTSIDLSGIVFPCVNCELTSEGLYKVPIKGEITLLRPFEARRKLFEITSVDQIAKLNKTGEILRFLLSQEVAPDEAEKALLSLLATQDGRSVFILSFDSLYQSHERTILKLIVQRKAANEVLEGVKKSVLAGSDQGLEITLLAVSNESVPDLSPIIEKQLDQNVTTTIERIALLEQLLDLPEIKGITERLRPQLAEYRSAIENTSNLRASYYSEAGLKPEVRKIMRKQRLLTLTGKAVDALPEEAPALLQELTNAYDSNLDSPSIHAAFRHLISVVPNAAEILAPIKEELMRRDTTIQLMLNPPPTFEKSLFAIGLAVLVVIIIALVIIFSWRRRWKREQEIELREGLSFDERRELQILLGQFDLTGNVGLEELKQAFRRKAKELHPDSRSTGNGSNGNGEEGESFIALQQAYSRARELISAFRR